ncbi:MAG TPA: DUF2911 domain-containing protein [Vicinamibacterales bacterium]|nr:DUF2911 domain-containing protein [Vicinamibacterales bacterium]
MKTIASVVVMTAAFAAFALKAPSWAQAPKPSQHGSVSQQIANTTITIEYNRPVARGRTLFGSLVPYGRVWCPGADYCTTIQLSTDVKFNGQTLAAGTYSLWAEPQPERWTMIFNRSQPVFHTRYPADQDVLRVQTTARPGQQMETLAFYFPVVDGNHAELVLHWGTVVVPLSIDVN